MIGLLVSVGALLVVSAGMAWHIWRQHRQPAPVQSDSDLPAPRLPEETDIETEETS